jgi:hypothetical protein
MSASFASVVFKEIGQGGGQGYPVWAKAGNVVLKKIPGSGDTVIQVIGTKLPTAAIPARMTAAQLTSMYGVVGTSGTLVFHFESTTARLESIDQVEEFFHGADRYTAVLHFIRSSSSI